MAHYLPIEKKILILNSLVEGNSICSTVRMTGVHKLTILRLLCEAGERAQEILDREMVNLECKYIQVDEIWNFVFKKQKQCTEEEKRIGEVGDQYVFVAMDSQSKIVPSFLIGKRSQHFALQMMKDLQYRIKNRFQLSTDSFKGYPGAVDEVFGDEIDFGRFVRGVNADKPALPVGVSCLVDADCDAVGLRCCCCSLRTGGIKDAEGSSWVEGCVGYEGVGGRL